MNRRQLMAWCVHFYTALGLVAAGGIAVAIIHNTPEAFRLAFLLMFIAVVIDATDGTLARWVRVKEVLPQFDGRRLDDLIDFLTYTCLPLLLLYRAGILTDGLDAVLVVPLLASAYGFCQTSAKTADGYFLGFPSYWNVIAFYLYVFRPPQALTLAILVFFAILTFVPARYLYPSNRGRLNRLTNHLGAAWAVLLIWILVRFPEGSPGADSFTKILAALSLAFPIYYLTASWIVSLRALARARREKRLEMEEVRV